MTLEEQLHAIANCPLDYVLRFPAREGSEPVSAKAAVCALFRNGPQGNSFLDAEILLIERSHTVLTHQGQVAFPGGAIDSADHNSAGAALRECEEEVGLDCKQVRVVGLLPSVSTMTGNFLVDPVIAYWERTTNEPPLVLQEREVAFAEWVSVRALLESRVYDQREIYGLPVKAPVFMWGDRKMWGLTAWIFDLILKRYDTLLT